MKKVLIVEDDPIVAKIYSSRLAKEGYEVEVAGDGQQGFFRISEWKPDAVVLDLMLPKMNGLEVLKKIRAMRNHENLPVFVLTNAYITSMIQESMGAGATAVYNKASATPRQILDALHTTFSRGLDASPSAGATCSGQAPPLPSASRRAPDKEDQLFGDHLRQALERSARVWIADMRRCLQDISKALDDTTRAAHIEQLYRKLGTYSTNAGMAGVTCLAKLGSAAQALVKEFMEKPRNITPSSLRTTAQALDCLNELSQGTIPADLADNPPIQVLVVDDDILSRRAVVLALERASLKPVAVPGAVEAIEKASASKFDLILLDIQMPGMNGFEICEKLRQNGPNKTTPIVFVTSAADFQSRAQSMLRGGTDLIAKPFIFIELTVSALTYALRSRGGVLRSGASTPRTASSPPPPPAAPELFL